MGDELKSVRLALLLLSQRSSGRQKIPTLTHSGEGPPETRIIGIAAVTPPLHADFHFVVHGLMLTKIR